MSSRPYAPRHRRARNNLRLPATLTGGFILPTAAAATLVLTATGATVAESRAPSVALTGQQAALLGPTAQAQAADARADDEQAAQRRSEAQLAAAAILGRQQEQLRVARDRARQALATKKAAAAKAKAKAKATATARAKAAALARTHTWVMPVHGFTFTSGFKMRWGRMHTGNDLACPTGTPISAMSTGEVIFTGWMGGGGNTTKIRYWDGTVSFYEHQSRITATVGQQVGPGDIVGYVGNTGHSFGSHLHLEIHPSGGDAIDPHPWMTDHKLDY